MLFHLVRGGSIFQLTPELGGHSKVSGNLSNSRGVDRAEVLSKQIQNYCKAGQHLSPVAGVKKNQ